MASRRYHRKRSRYNSLLGRQHRSRSRGYRRKR
jgi:hypothetical protein